MNDNTVVALKGRFRQRRDAHPGAFNVVIACTDGFASRNFVLHDFHAQPRQHQYHRRPGANCIHLHLFHTFHVNQTTPSITCRSTSSKMANPNTASTAPQPPTATPIEPLKNDTARIYTHIHPIIVLSLYAYKFQAIVTDPVPALLSTLVPLAVMQVLFVALCLPPTGGAAQGEKKKAGEKKRVAAGKAESGPGGKIVVRCTSCSSPLPFDICVHEKYRIDRANIYNCIAGIPLPRSYCSSFHSPPHSPPCSLRRPRYNTSCTHASRWRSHRAAQHSSTCLCSWCERGDMEMRCCWVTACG